MDEKTLEYMGERVDKARKLKERIKVIQSRINIFSGEALQVITLNMSNTGTYRLQNALPLSIMKSEVIPAIIKTLETYRDSLQKELDEL